MTVLTATAARNRDLPRDREANKGGAWARLTEFARSQGLARGRMDARCDSRRDSREGSEARRCTSWPRFSAFSLLLVNMLDLWPARPDRLAPGGSSPNSFDEVSEAKARGRRKPRRSQEGNSDAHRPTMGHEKNPSSGRRQPDLHARRGIPRARRDRIFSLLSGSTSATARCSGSTRRTTSDRALQEQSERAAETTTGCSWWALAEFNRVWRRTPT